MCENPTRSDSSSSRAPDADAGETAVTELFHTRFDRGTDAIVVAIVETVAAVTDQPVTAMPPLFERIDTEALDELVGRARSRSSPVEVTFSYQGCLVTVSSGGDVVVEAPEP